MSSEWQGTSLRSSAQVKLSMTVFASHIMVRGKLGGPLKTQRCLDFFVFRDPCLGHQNAFLCVSIAFSDYTACPEPNKAPEPTTMAVTIRAPSSTARASHGRGSSLTLG